MLTNHVANSQRKRTSSRTLTAEGIALKELRRAKRLSMRRLGELVKKSDSYISHIENGRLDFPSGSSLDALLAVFDLKPKSFFERARKCRSRLSQELFITNWLRQATDDDINSIYALITSGSS